MVTPSIAPKTIDDVILSLQRTLEISPMCPSRSFTGCTITPKGMIVLVDWDYDQMIMASENGSLVIKNNISSQPVDVSCIDDKTFAISYNVYPSKIGIINLSSAPQENKIGTTNMFYGITNRQGRLIYCSRGKGIQSVDFIGNNACTIVEGREMLDWSYVAASGDKLYHTDPTTNTVTCYNITGEKGWEYKDDSILQNIRGVTTDQADNAYVASLGNDSIVVISTDGKHARRLLGKEDGLIQPCGIYIDKTRNNMLVSCFNVHMYKVS